jgi:hypothetical protein
MAGLFNSPAGLAQSVERRAKKQKAKKKEISSFVLGIAERGGRTRSLKIKSLACPGKTAQAATAYNIAR